MITGKLTDSKTNEPLAFANVYLSDPAGNPVGNVGTITDINGNYSFGNAHNTQYVTFSYVGYTRKTIQVNTSTLNVMLEPTNTILPEVEIISTRIVPIAGILLTLVILGKSILYNKNKN